LKADILVAALSALQMQGSASHGGNSGAAVVLATDVVESYECVRQYFQKVAGCLERVDPQLSNNTELVDRLVDWEESWEIASRYVQKPALLGAVCDLVEEIRLLQRVAPEFKSMCDDCDVELFLALPRIVWLWFLCKPDTRAELLRSLLPHRFGGENGAGGTCDAEISVLLEKFRQVNRLLMESSRTCNAASYAWELLVRRVVKGSSCTADFDGLVSESVAAAQAATEGLMRDLEKYSMELQRHCADDWNQTSAILLQCLEGSMGKNRDLEDDSQSASL
jgi:NAD(P)-dependent dehydrogenase (short-subunit alcohol dehydrogenase family)